MCDTRVVMVRVPPYNRVDANEQTDFRVRAACGKLSCCVVFPNSAACCVLLAAAIEKFLPVVVWDRF